MGTPQALSALRTPALRFTSPKCVATSYRLCQTARGIVRNFAVALFRKSFGCTYKSVCCIEKNAECALLVLLYQQKHGNCSIFAA